MSCFHRGYKQNTNFPAWDPLTEMVTRGLLPFLDLQLPHAASTWGVLGTQIQEIRMSHWGRFEPRKCQSTFGKGKMRCRKIILAYVLKHVFPQARLGGR